MQVKRYREKRNWPLTLATVAYLVMLADLGGSTFIAFLNDGVPQTQSSIMLGPIAFNYISVTAEFVTATVLVVIGLMVRRRSKRSAGLKPYRPKEFSGIGKK